ncbi:SDR family NAD(P)-dependent oxidoreductase [Ktedonobacter racemifer]|uniref:Short-chain dehydrogenase/reductase SDR n=1 Tax=Ktedonobacter racemifer DSM 44963 TaxID=485913 RepID=D6TD46_KTERA|nr:SDR family NAD(P)-dependent oxidoreductase [Ktedonobacter racemifer]EFH90097.1 short-chain dehydrogenase/reductase SDR [Ktedonobacter racemifer DSM 44963]
MRLDGKSVIITGVSQKGQMGFALAEACAREGARLTISARSEQRVLARATELRAQGAEVLAIPADLTGETGAQKVIAQTRHTYGQIDILINLAGGLTQFGPFEQLSLAQWEGELKNNLRATFLCCRAAWPIFQQQGKGTILNFSRAGDVWSASPNMLAYNCAKAGVDALTATLAREGKAHNIRVNALGPGLIITQSNLEAMHPSEEELRTQWVHPEQIIEAALFLISDTGSGVTGTLLPVRGLGI